MVSNKFLACLSVKLDFHRHLRKSGAGMQRAIQDFVNDVQNAELAAKDGARDFWVNITGAIPKVCFILLLKYIQAIHKVERYRLWVTVWKRSLAPCL